MLQPNNQKFDFSSPQTEPNSNFQGDVPTSYNPSANIPYNPQQFDTTNNNGQNPQQNEEPVYKGVHPIAAFFHISFKAAALLTFILGTIFSLNYVILFVVTILFLAADFWTTKNVSGRLLVSLRWWNEVLDDGSSRWIFESASDVESKVHPFDRWFFWVTTGGNCAAWVLLVVFNLFSFSRLPITIIGAVLGGANFVGFLKCSRDAKKKVTSFMLARAGQQPELLRQAASVI